MSTFRTTVERVRILPHPGADRLELAQVGLFRAVVAKGQFQDGQLAVYIPDQAILPPDLIKELNLTGKLAGKNKNRVKTVRLRGVYSQGIVARPKALEGEDYEALFANRTDLSERLGIIKWVPPVPVGMSGDVDSDSELLRWVDIENIKRFPDLFTPGEMVSATEKAHGTASLFTVRVADGKTLVSSKGLGARNLVLRHSDRNLYWRTFDAYNLGDFAQFVAARLALQGSEVTHVGVFGETFGAGVQDLTYGAKATEKPGFLVFDIAVRPDNGDVPFWLDTDVVRQLAVDFGIGMVPELYRGPYSEAAIEAAATGKETISGKELHIREGVVVRPLREGYSAVTGGRKIGKWVSEAYLTRGGNATEYE